MRDETCFVTKVQILPAGQNRCTSVQFTYEHTSLAECTVPVPTYWAHAEGDEVHGSARHTAREQFLLRSKPNQITEPKQTSHP
jgi:hypothetical protein